MTIVKQGADYKSKLEEHIARTGYPLEIEVTDALERNHWDVVSNSHFIDPDLGKLRELDIRAYDSERDTGRVGLMFNMLIECKQSSEHSLVLFPRPSSEWLDISGQYGDSNWTGRRSRSGSSFPKQLPWGAMPYLFDNLHYNQLRRASNTYVLAKPGDNKPKPDIYRAVNVLSKSQYVDTQEDTEGLPMIFSFLVIVFDGKIFEATISGGRVKLEESTHSAIRMKYMKIGSPYNEARFLIDVVRRDYFPSFLDLIQSEIDQLLENLKGEPELESYLTMDRPRPSNSSC